MLYTPRPPWSFSLLLLVAFVALMGLAGWRCCDDPPPADIRCTPVKPGSDLQCPIGQCYDPSTWECVPR